MQGDEIPDLLAVISEIWEELNLRCMPFSQPVTCVLLPAVASVTTLRRCRIRFFARDGVLTRSKTKMAVLKDAHVGPEADCLSRFRDSEVGRDI